MFPLVGSITVSYTHLDVYKRQMYPVAEIKNCTYEQVKNILGATFIETLLDKSSPTTSEMSSINGLRNRLPNAHINTYTYSPLVGVTSVTDARGLTTYYTYDSTGRLTECYILKNGRCV